MMGNFGFMGWGLFGLLFWAGGVVFIWWLYKQDFKSKELLILAAILILLPLLFLTLTMGWMGSGTYSHMWNACFR